MIDLSFYALREGEAEFYHVEPTNAWLWAPGPPILPHNLATRSELIGAGWEDTGPFIPDKPIAPFALYQYLADVRYTDNAGRLHLWTPTVDRERMEKLPVLLACPAPPGISLVARTVRSNRILPPAQFGELAIILQGNGKPLCCSLHKLGDESQQLQQCLGMALDTLAAAHALERDAWLTQWKEIQAMARDLARAYWRAYQDTQQIERPPMPNVFKDGHTWMALNMHLQGMHTAMYHNRNWKEEPGVLPYYTHQFSTGYTKTWLQQPGESVNADLASEELTKHLAALGDLEGDIVTIQIAQALASSDEKGETMLTPEAVLEYRGIQPMRDAEGYRAGHRAEDIQTVIGAFERTAWLRLKVWQQIRRRGGKDVEISGESSYILIEERIYQRPLDEVDKGRLIAWKYRMGKWLRPFMDDSQAGRYFGMLMKKTLEYDYYRQTWEKRLARYFTVHLCIAAKEGAAHIKRHIGKLLEECGLTLNERDPQRTKDRFEKALRQLVADGIIGDWKYTDDSPLPARHWLPIWLDRTVAITLGPKALEAYQPMIEAAKTRRAMMQALLVPMPSKKRGKRQGN